AFFCAGRRREIVPGRGVPVSYRGIREPLIERVVPGEVEIDRIVILGRDRREGDVIVLREDSLAHDEGGVLYSVDRADLLAVRPDDVHALLGDKISGLGIHSRSSPCPSASGGGVRAEAGPTPARDIVLACNRMGYATLW